MDRCLKHDRFEERCKACQRALLLKSDIFNLLHKWASLTNEERLWVKNFLFEDYCEHCGRYDGNILHGCQCWNEE
jgi:hypothetical protein